MTIADQIKKKIVESFDPLHFELINESDKHRGHVGDNGTGESHFKLMVVSDVFDGCSHVQRHRLVYESLGGLVGHKVHAISLNLKAPSEYISK